MLALFWVWIVYSAPEEARRPFLPLFGGLEPFTAFASSRIVATRTTTSLTSQAQYRRFLVSKKMATWESFDAVFYFDRNYAHDKKTLDRIVANRRSLQNQLFIDRLLQLMGVKPGGMMQAFSTGLLLNIA